MTFDLQPVLQGDLIEARPLVEADFQPLYDVASDPLIWAQHPASDRYREDVFKSFFREAIESGGALVVVDADSGDIIGSSRYHAYAPANRTVEIGWTFLARKYWGGTFNRELKRLMLRHAFRFVDAVLFLIGPENLRSRKAVEKIGARCIGSRAAGPGGTSLVYELNRSNCPPEFLA